MAAETKIEKLKIGELIPNFRLPTVNGSGQTGTWDYKQYRNLVLLFFPSVECIKCRILLGEIAKHYGDYQQMEAEVLSISPDEVDHLRQFANDLALPFPVLYDSDGHVTDLFLNQTEQATERTVFEAAIFIADRWGEIFMRKMVEKARDLPAEEEVREWLEFIELQCEECFPAEWPPAPSETH